MRGGGGRGHNKWGRRGVPTLPGSHGGVSNLPWGRSRGPLPGGVAYWDGVEERALVRSWCVPDKVCAGRGRVPERKRTGWGHFL